MGYWPSYARIGPHHRGAYLTWLTDGRRDPNCEIGYVFLFLYGLERRVLVDVEEDQRASSDVCAIKEEVIRLLSKYGGNRSFRGYASQFLDFLSRNEFLTGKIGSPPVGERGSALPASLRIPIGRMARAGTGLPADWALSWLRSAPDLPLRTPGIRCADEFDELFQIEFARRYPEGMKLKECKKKIRLHYHAASSSLCNELSHTLDVPDVTALVGPRRQLLEVADWCQAELDAYSRLIGKHADEKDTLASAVLLPQDLLVKDPPKELKELMSKVEIELGDKEFAAMQAKDVLNAWLPNDGSKQRKKAAVEGVRLLGRLGIGVEPDVRFGGRGLTQDDEVVVFRLSAADTENASQHYGAATVLVHLAALVSVADGEVTENEETLLRDRIAEGLMLADSEQKRLSAHLQWLIRNPPSSVGIAKRLEVVPVSQREAIGRFLVSVAWVDGHVTPDEVESLTKIYKTLGIEADIVHQHIHEVRSADDVGPVTVVPAEKVKSFKIPEEKPAGVTLDRGKIAVMQQEGLKVSRIMGEIFGDDEELEPQDGTMPGASSETIRGLDKGHSELLTRLSQQSTWSRKEYETLVEESGLFPDGALEILNEVAYDVCDEPLTDGEDPIVINQEVYREVIR
jgi:tellurite resistance protein